MIETEVLGGDPARIERSGRNWLIAELAVVGSAGILPPMIFSFVDVIRQRPFRSAIYTHAGLAEIPAFLHDLGIIALVVFIVWTAGDLPVLGLRFRSRVDIPLAAVLFCAWLTRAYLRGTFAYHLSGPAVSPVVLSLGLVSIGVNVVFQELVFRSHMIPRLTELFRNRWIAWGISTILFGMWHLYEGGRSAMFVTLDGAALGLVFLFTGRSVAGMIVHFAMNGTLFLLVCGYLRPS